LKLLLDEDSQAKYLFNLLQAAGHDVVTVNELDLMSRPDEVVLEYARHCDRVVLTRNCADFQELHQTNSEHSGILAIYQN
jgi:predicted nuclease of predicted toxin-antitoxin system